MVLCSCCHPYSAPAAQSWLSGEPRREGNGICSSSRNNRAAARLSGRVGKNSVASPVRFTFWQEFFIADKSNYPDERIYRPFNSTRKTPGRQLPLRANHSHIAICVCFKRASNNAGHDFATDRTKGKSFSL